MCVCLHACIAGVMSVEHVRVWQRSGAINVGCDPSTVTANGETFRTAEYISCNRDLYVPESEQAQWRFAYCSAFDSQVGGGHPVGCSEASCGRVAATTALSGHTKLVPPPRL